MRKSNNFIDVCKPPRQLKERAKTVAMRQVTFSLGPFLDQYEDGHPPEKNCEEERRRYRSGLPSKVEPENAVLDASQFEEAFQQWLVRYKAQQTSSSSEDRPQKEGSYLVGPLRVGEDSPLKGESIPAADYAYKSFKPADGRGENSKECFVIDITALPPTFGTTETTPGTQETKTLAQQTLANCWRTTTRSLDNTTAETSSIRPCTSLPLYDTSLQLTMGQRCWFVHRSVKHVAVGAILTGMVLILTNL